MIERDGVSVATQTADDPTSVDDFDRLSTQSTKLRISKTRTREEPHARSSGTASHSVDRFALKGPLEKCRRPSPTPLRLPRRGSQLGAPRQRRRAK